jgi:hypothetical protein
MVSPSAYRAAAENEALVFTTGGMESLTPDDAVEVARRIVDGPGLI